VAVCAIFSFPSYI